MADHDLFLDAHLADDSCKAKSQRLYAKDVQLRCLGGLGVITGCTKPPARIIFAKAGWFHQRDGFKLKRVGLDVSPRRHGHFW